MARLRRSWRRGNFRPDGPEMERLARPGDPGLTDAQLAALYPSAGEGWRAPAPGSPPSAAYRQFLAETGGAR
jgi:hypothetical protein